MSHHDLTDQVLRAISQHPWTVSYIAAIVTLELALMLYLALR